MMIETVEQAIDKCNQALALLREVEDAQGNGDLDLASFGASVGDIADELDSTISEAGGVE